MRTGSPSNCRGSASISGGGRSAGTMGSEDSLQFHTTEGVAVTDGRAEVAIPDWDTERAGGLRSGSAALRPRPGEERDHGISGV